jgi:hypothetical protein
VVNPHFGGILLFGEASPPPGLLLAKSFEVEHIR